MVLQLGQRWLTGSKATVPSAFHEGKWFFRAFGEYLLTLRSRDTDARLARSEVDQVSSSIVTDVIATGWSGRSRAFRGAFAILSTTSRPLVTWPKIV
jgi:hypothetical protein